MSTVLGFGHCSFYVVFEGHFIVNNYTPRYFALWTNSRLCSWIVYELFVCLILLVILKSLHFCGWNSIDHLFSHSWRLLRSLWRSCTSCMDFTFLYNNASSAKRLIFDVLASSAISLIYAKKSKGPSTEPWGIPDVTCPTGDSTLWWPSALLRNLR